MENKQLVTQPLPFILNGPHIELILSLPNSYRIKFWIQARK